jgi:hypothetical protein
MIGQNILLFERSFERESPLPSRERVRVRGRNERWSPSPHSSPVKGEEVNDFTAGEKCINAPASRDHIPTLFLWYRSELFYG